MNCRWATRAFISRPQKANRTWSPVMHAARKCLPGIWIAMIHGIFFICRIARLSHDFVWCRSLKERAQTSQSRLFVPEKVQWRLDGQRPHWHRRVQVQALECACLVRRSGLRDQKLKNRTFFLKTAAYKKKRRDLIKAIEKMTDFMQVKFNEENTPPKI